MNILIVANHYVVCSARYAADAFTRLGHTVTHVGQPMGRHIWGVDVPAEYVWTPEYDNLFDFALDDALVIYMDSDPDTLDNRTAINAVCTPTTIVWGVDNHVRDYRRPYFDHYFLAHKSVSVMPWSRHVGDAAWTAMKTPVYVTHDDMTWLPCAYDNVAFPPSPIAWADREYDVCCIGVMYEKRWQLVNAMRAAGLKVLAGTGLVYEAYKQAHWNSRVALVSSFNGDMPIRLFEGAGMGCAVLHDDIPDLLQFHDLPPSINMYTSVDDAVSMVKALLEHSSNATFPAQSAEWASSHSWDARAQVIVDWYAARNGGAA